MAISGHVSDQAVLATLVIGTLLSCCAVAARLFTRFLIVRNAGVDDVLICAAAVSISASCMSISGC